MLSNETLFLFLSLISGNFVLFFGGHILLWCKGRTDTPSLVLRAPLVPGIGHMQGKMPQFCSIFGFGAIPGSAQGFLLAELRITPGRSLGNLFSSGVGSV